MNAEEIKIVVLLIVMGVLIAMFTALTNYNKEGALCLSNPLIYGANKTMLLNNAKTIDCSCSIKENTFTFNNKEFTSTKQEFVFNQWKPTQN